MTLGSQLPSLVEAVELCEGRIDPAIQAAAQTTLEKAGVRLSMSPDVTVIALAGATGAGKSTLFNALSRTALAQPGVRRPMTTDAMAITFGQSDTSALLDWLKIPRRHVIANEELAGIVLLDLADFDSVVSEHREEFDRLLEVVDQVLWVVDPQKYADAVLHERYLRRYATHQEVMTFVLNHVDKLVADELKAIEKDFSRLLVEDGLSKPTIFAVSAATDWGIDKLRTHLAGIASTKQAHLKRLEADMRTHGVSLQTQVGPRPAGTIGKKEAALVLDGCLQAAGVDEIVDAVQVSYTQHGRSATGLPWLAWTKKFRVDPLKRLHLDQFAGKKKKKAIEAPHLERTSRLAHPVAQAQIDTVLRTVSEEATSQLPKQWATVVGQLVKDQKTKLPDVLDQAVINADLGLNEGHGWWKIIRFFQWVFFVVVLLGLGWLILNFAMTSFLGFPDFVAPRFGNLPWPTWMVLGGLVLGFVLAMVSRLGVFMGAKAASAKARKRLRSALEVVATEQIIDPINQELQRHDTARQILADVLA
ncbi:MAG: 50S ribosome-binding GTPase [Propionibacteriaceae bacterium]|nr:50S ribosome-binding GTPase [Propionibacteriaceae bacterium]